jgi:predicted transcriptional regulator YdeE
MYSTYFQSSSQNPKNKEIPSNYYEFWSKELHSKKHQKKKKTLMFECYDLLDSME